MLPTRGRDNGPRQRPATTGRDNTRCGATPRANCWPAPAPGTTVCRPATLIPLPIFIPAGGCRPGRTVVALYRYRKATTVGGRSAPRRLLYRGDPRHSAHYSGMVRSGIRTILRPSRQVHNMLFEGIAEQICQAVDEDTRIFTRWESAKDVWKVTTVQSRRRTRRQWRPGFSRIHVA